MFTDVTLTADWPAGTTGYVDVELPFWIQNGGAGRAPFTRRLLISAAGTVETVVSANDDAGTLPTGTYYIITETVNDKRRSYPLVVQAASPGGTIDLNSVTPSAVGTPAITGQPGPAGPQGPAGTNGTNGTNGAVTLNRHFQSRALSALSVANATFVDIPLAAGVESSLGAGTWNGVLATLGESGLYLLSWGIKWADNTAGGRSGHILLGASTQLALSEGAPAPTAGFSAIGGSTVRRLSSGSTLKLRGFQTSGGGLDVLGDSRTFMSVTPLF